MSEAGAATLPSEAPLFVVAETHDVGDHHLRVLTPAREDWLDVLAAKYRKLRMLSRHPAQALSLEGVDILSVDEVESELATSVIPTYEEGNFGVGRSDFAEVILTVTLEEEYGCRYGYQSLCHRELRQRPGRGIDIIGVEISTDPTVVSLVLGEAKTSSDANSPPAVVDTNSDCLAVQHRGHLDNIAATADEVWAASRDAESVEIQQLLRIAGSLLRKGAGGLRIIAASGMARPATAQAPGDFGTFHADPAKYSPADVRFLLFRLPGHIDELTKELLARAAADSGEVA
jgi:hypothetical protein